MKMIEQRKRRFVSILKLNGEDITSSITPNTELMEYVENQIKKQLILIQKDFEIECVFSPSKVQGEGEVKILNHISNSECHKDTFLILSPDMDLVPGALSVNKQNIVVISDQNRSKLEVFSKPLFIEHYIPKREIGKKCIDMAILMLTRGNDYLPRMAGHHSDFYGYYKDYILLGKHIINIDKDYIEIDLEVFSNVVRTKSKNFYENKSITDIRKYIDGLVWNIQMYVTGNCPDYTLEGGSFIHARHIYELILHNKKKKESNIIKVKYTDSPKSHPLNPILFSMNILPTNAQHLLTIKEKKEIWKSPNDPIKFQQFDIEIPSKLKQTVILKEKEKIQVKETVKSIVLLDQFDTSTNEIVFTKLIECENYSKKGYCSNNNCKFDHTPPKCIYFLRGKCLKENCKFLHPKIPLYERIYHDKRY